VAAATHPVADRVLGGFIVFCIMNTALAGDDFNSVPVPLVVFLRISFRKGVKNGA
jgi:hypothetical protein